MARTPKPKRDRSAQITLRVSDAENEAFRKKADELDLDLTTWIRLACRKAAGLETV